MGVFVKICIFEKIKKIIVGNRKVRRSEYRKCLIKELRNFFLKKKRRNSEIEVFVRNSSRYVINEMTQNNF